MALAAALELDREPRADTRTAACAHPVTALLYALLVDRAAHPETRTACDQMIWCAYRYAYALDRAIDDALGKRMIASKVWDDPTLSSERAALAKVTGAPPPVIRVATRTLPKRPAKPTALCDASIPEDEAAAIAASTAAGLARLGLASDEDPSEIVERLHAYLADPPKVSAKAKAVMAEELACAWAAALHRAFAWQWIRTKSEVGMASPERGWLHDPRVQIKHGKKNRIADLFNQIAMPELLPKPKRGRLEPF
jgi:hypothetical protein